MNAIQDRDDYPYCCSTCGYLYNRDEIVLEHHLSPICDGCFNDQEQLDMDEVDLDGIADFREDLSEDIKKFQRLERR